MKNTINSSASAEFSEKKNRFSSLCTEDEAASPPESVGIGTYNEKRIHRILKKFVCEDESCHEVKIGRYVADVLKDGQITEIQTAGFTSLNAKIRFYLENTDYNITVIHPMIAEKTIIRTNKGTGELIRTKRSPKHLKPIDALPELIYISEFLDKPRFEIKFLMIRADEYRYSEKIRYRKKGAYDNDIVPRELIDISTVRSANDIKDLVPSGLRDAPHRAAELSSALGMKGRKLYRALACLTALGILKKIPEGTRGYIYEFCP